MRRPTRAIVALLTVSTVSFGVALGLPASAQETADLDKTVRAQGELIQELQQELDRVRQEQQRSEDRVRVLEDQIPSGEGAGGLSAAYVDQRIEAFDTAPESRLFLSGYGSAQYRDAEDVPSTFSVQFNPIFHFRLTERLHFNAELVLQMGKEDKIEEVDFAAMDVERETEMETELELEFATIDFLATDWLTLSAGKFLVPFNTFGLKLHPQWINKLASNPPIYGGHGETGIIPILADIGIQASGGTALWSDDAKINYAFYVLNGPLAETDDPTEPPEELLEFEFEGNDPDDNDNKAVGGRIGFLPIPNLEVGVSYLTGRVSGPGGRFNLLGADAWYWWKGLELRGEFMRLSRQVSGVNPDVWGYWVQAAYRLKHRFPETTGFGGFLGRLEPVVRWSEIRDLKAVNREQVALGLDYWLFESVPLKFTYEFNSGAVKDDRLFFQAAYGF